MFECRAWLAQKSVRATATLHDYFARRNLRAIHAVGRSITRRTHRGLGAAGQLPLRNEMVMPELWRPPVVVSNLGCTDEVGREGSRTEYRMKVFKSRAR